MSIEEIKNTLADTMIPVTMSVGNETMEFNVARCITPAKADDFMQLVIHEGARNNTYGWASIEPAIDYATVAVFTDIDLTKWNRNESYFLLYNTDVLKIIDQNTNASFLFTLRDAARNMMRFALETAKPKSNSEKAYEAVAELLQKLNTLADTLVEKVANFNMSDDALQKLFEMAEQVSKINPDEAALKLVTTKED